MINYSDMQEQKINYPFLGLCAFAADTPNRNINTSIPTIQQGLPEIFAASQL